MVAELAFTFFDKLFDVVGLVREDKKTKRADKDDALKAIASALQITQRYVHERQEGLARDTDREWDISNAWRMASIPLGKVDHELSRVCWDKGGYWMKSEIWTDEMIEAKGIGIERVDARIREMLG